ncbi:MAG: U32 family peptidase [Clostridia bacterium]|nr:U32 family peptidase [Clostridia bacterium]
MKKPELLAPAGTLNKAKMAFYYGADAVYFAGKKFGLRAFAQNFEENEMKEAVNLAHGLGKKVYITVNILAHEDDFNGLEEYILYLQSIKVDALIVSDLGIISLIRQVAPEMEIHVSTQANVLNSYAIKFLANLGIKRIILARELSVEEIKKIKANIPDNISLECFVHGAMCISYSGRCLLSNYFAGRDSNRGECVQTCRWEYAISEKNRKGEYFPIQEDERGTYILNSKDLCMISHLKELFDAGVDSFKIEGRMKSEYYVGTIVNAYRRGLDNLFEKKAKTPIKTLISELEKASHRLYSTGFYFGANDKEYFKDSMPVQTHKFIALVLEDFNNGYVKIEQRNQFKVGDELEVLSPDDNFNKKFKVKEIKDEKDNQIDVAKTVQQILYLKINYPLKKGDILRMKNI